MDSWFLALIFFIWIPNTVICEDHMEPSDYFSLICYSKCQQCIYFNTVRILTVLAFVMKLFYFISKYFCQYQDHSQNFHGGYDCCCGTLHANMVNIGSIIWLIVVAAIWGLSTPLLRHGSAGIEKVSEKNAFNQWVAELYFLITNWKYVFPFLINQSGSALYALALASADLSLAVPLTNSLTFIFVSISGRLLGEREGKSVSYLGMTLVVAGVTLCILDRAWK